MNKKGEAGEYSALMTAIILIIVIGSISFIMSSFVDTNPQDYDGYLSPLVNFVSQGYNFNFVIPIPILPDYDLNFNFNPFALFGGNIQNYLTSQLLALALFPGWISIPLIIIIVASLLYVLVKLVQGFIP